MEIVKGLSVSEINQYIKSVYERDFFLRDLWIQGEISNYKTHYSGHMYFQLKDEKAVIPCVMFKSSASRLAFVPKNGDQVWLHGYVSYYEKTGQTQFYADRMQAEGKGDLFLQLEALKEKLAAEGLFAEIHKKKLPFLPQRIGVVTSPTGAVWHDIQQVARRRFPGVDLMLAPVSVQGKNAAGEICQAIEYFNDQKKVELLIVGRGGGSLEDLWAFNMEKVARAIFASKIPVISAVGHETDFTVADMVADMRAATPSAAAELAVPEQKELLKRIDVYSQKLANYTQGRLSYQKDRLQMIKKNVLMGKTEKVLAEKLFYLDQLWNSQNHKWERTLQEKVVRVENCREKLIAYNPLKVLERGYALVTDANQGKTIQSVAKVSLKEEVILKMRDGHLWCRIEKKEADEDAENKEKF